MHSTPILACSFTNISAASCSPLEKPIFDVGFASPLGWVTLLFIPCPSDLSAATAGTTSIHSKGVHSAGTPLSLEDARRSGRGLRRALQQRSSGQRHRMHHAEGHARRASARDSGRVGSEAGSGEGTAEKSPPTGRVTGETDYFRIADHSLRTIAFALNTIRL